MALHLSTLFVCYRLDDLKSCLPFGGQKSSDYFSRNAVHTYSLLSNYGKLAVSHDFILLPTAKELGYQNTERMFLEIYVLLMLSVNIHQKMGSNMHLVTLKINVL